MTKFVGNNIGLPTLATAPSSPAAGDTYYNTTFNKPYTYNGTVWVDLTETGTVDGAIGYWGSFWSTQSQTAASANTEYLLTFNNTDADSSGVSIASSNRLTFANAGVYSIIFSVQWVNTSSSIYDANIWLKKNGSNIADSDSKWSVVSSHGGTNGHAIGAVNFVLKVNAGDYIQLAWQVTNTAVSIEYIAAASPAPAIPSVILTATQVMHQQVGPGVAAGGTTGQVLTKNSGTDYDTSWTTVSSGSGDITDVVAGSGLTGGATSGSATLNVGAGTGITVNADDVAIDPTVVATLSGTQTLTNKTLTSPILTTPNLGTPSAVNLSNATSLADSALAATGTAGTYTKVTTDSKGRVSSGTTLSASDIPTLTASKISDFDTQVRTSKVTDLTAPTSSFSMNSQKIVSVLDPTLAQDAATKAYVDNVTSGINTHAPVVAASTANISGTYTNGTSDQSGGTGIGATFTASANGAISLDSVSPTIGQRVLIKNQTDQKQNGVYTVTTVGTAGTPFVLTRATDSDNSTANQVRAGDFVYVNSDPATTSNGGQGWVMNTVGTGTGGTIVIGTNNLNWVQFTGVSDTTAGGGLTRSGNIIAVGAGTGITVNANDVAVNTLVVPTISGSNTVTLTTSGTTALTLPTSGTVATTSNNLGAFSTSTSAAIGVGTIELGAASDTTIARASAGVISVEGITIPRLYSAALTGTGTSFTVPHGLGAVWVTVMVYDVTTGKYIIPDHTINLSSGTPTGTVTITFPASVTGSNYRVVITG